MPMRVLTRLLRMVGRAIYRAGLHRAVIALRPKASRVLLYHDCAPHGTPFTEGLGSTIHPDTFARHLRFLRRNYNLAPAVDLATGTAEDFAVFITFDDGYRTVATHAAPRLREVGASATTFLVTDVVGNERLVWVNALVWLINCHPQSTRRLIALATGVRADAPIRDLVNAVRASLHPSTIDDLLHSASSEAGVDLPSLARDAALYLDWSDVESLQATGMAFGNHSASHPSFAILGVHEARAEYAKARDILGSRGCDGHVFALPFGDYTGTVCHALVEAGATAIAHVGLRPMAAGSGSIGRIVAEHLEDDADLFSEIELVEPAKGVLRGWRDWWIGKQSGAADSRSASA